MTITDHPANWRQVTPVPGPTIGSRPPVDRRATGSALPRVGVSLVAGITAVLWLANGGLGQVGDPGGLWLILGQLAGIAAALAALVGLLLVARPAWLEQRSGLDELWAWHRMAGMSTIAAMLLHVVASMVGVAGGSLGRVWQQFLALLTGSSWMVAALASALLFLTVAVTSWRPLRTRMSYETWLGIHLTGYLAVLLGFGHQITLGTDFGVAAGASRWWWIGLFAATAAAIVWSRVGGLIAALATGRATVTSVIPVAVDTVAIELQARGGRLRRAKAGQFFLLRVLRSDLWWQAHAISLSARPRDGVLRFTIKIAGDGTRAMASIRPGTRLVLEGPYGRFTAERAAGRPVVLFGAGVGATVIRAVLADCVPEQSPVVIVRAPSEAHVPHLAELRSMVEARRGRLFVVTGPRTQWPGRQPFAVPPLRAAVPDVTLRDAFLCGPPGFEREVERSLRACGVSVARIHVERFGV